MLLAEQLTCRRGGRIALQSLDLHVEPREIVALVGPAQAGKTTALECFLGLHAITAGRIAIAGEPVPVAASLVASVPAKLSFPVEARVLAHVRSSCLSVGRRIPDAVLSATLERNGLAALCHERRIGDCGPAEQRYLALTLAWLTNAPTLLIDDPTAGLDAVEVDTVVTNLRAFRKGDRVILLATRDLAFARRLATRIVLLDHGAVVETFEPNLSRRAHEAGSFLAELID